MLQLRIAVSGEPAVVHGDGDRLRQVIANLLHNSAAAGASRVGMRVDRNGEYTALRLLTTVRLSFGHPRCGVRAVHPREPGAYTGGLRSRLGLSIVRAVVAAHGGTVEARNGAPRGGAVVTVRLPVR